MNDPLTPSLRSSRDDLTAATAAAATPGWLLGQIIQSAPVGMAVIDEAGVLRSVNPAYCGIYGYTESEMLGHSFLQLFAPEQHAPVLALHQNYLRNGGELRGEWEVRRRDGTGLHIQAESARFIADDGAPCRLLYVVDITERKRIEQALLASRQFLQAVLDGLTAHVCVLDAAGGIVAVNRAWRDFAAANGGDAETVHEGANYLSACRTAALTGEQSGHEASLFMQRLKEVLAGGLDHFELEYPCHGPQVQRWYLARVSRMRGSDPPRTVVAHDDITAVKLAQEKLRLSEALLQDMASSMPGVMFRLLHRAQGDWRFVYLGPGIETLFGVSVEAACAHTRSLRNCVLSEDLPAHDASIAAAVAARQPWELEYRIRTPEGQIKWIHAHARLKQGHGAEQLWTGVITDVSERKRMEEALKASEQTYRTLFETAPHGVVYHDTLGRITSANPAAQRILGLTLEQIRGLHSSDPIWHTIHEDGSDFPGPEHPAILALRTREVVHNVVMGLARPGRPVVWILVNATPLSKDGTVQAVYATFEDITEHQRLRNELRRQAFTDDLTGLANRRCLMVRLAQEFERVQRHPQLPCCVLALDLDHFKHINDRWGHAVGDAVLVHVARLMQQVTRNLDLVGRSGGEEFVVLLPDTSIVDAAALAERLRERVQSTPWCDGGHSVAVTLSIGASEVRRADTSADAALARADWALYEAKSGGRNAVRVAAG